MLFRLQVIIFGICLVLSMDTLRSQEPEGTPELTVDFDGDGQVSSAESALLEEWLESNNAVEGWLQARADREGVVDIANLSTTQENGPGMMVLQGGPPAPTPPFSCADVNGDGQVDITDPSYLLDWLFNGGVPPCRVYPPVLKTGQTTCWNNSTLINCPTEGQAFFGQDASYQAGHERRYQDNGDASITDLTTGLMWAKQPKNATFNWINALNNANTFSLPGKLEWRLPNTAEAFTIVDWNNFQPSLTPNVFDFSLILVNDERFWLSTTLTFDVRHKWRLNYEEGHIADNVYTSTTRRAWPVRSGIPPIPPPNTPPTPVPPFWCGDANGDANLDITDVSYILDFLFNGGDPPCMIQGTVLKTGLIHCYNEAGNGSPTQQVPCQPPNISGGGQDGYHQAGLSRNFQDNGNGTVLDLTTGLTWISGPVTVTIQQLGGNGRLTLTCSPKTDPRVMRVPWAQEGQGALDETDTTLTGTDHRQDSAG